MAKQKPNKKFNPNQKLLKTVPFASPTDKDMFAPIVNDFAEYIENTAEKTSANFSKIIEQDLNFACYSRHLLNNFAKHKKIAPESLTTAEYISNTDIKNVVDKLYLETKDLSDINDCVPIYLTEPFINDLINSPKTIIESTHRNTVNKINRPVYNIRHFLNCDVNGKSHIMILDEKFNYNNATTSFALTLLYGGYTELPVTIARIDNAGYLPPDMHTTLKIDQNTNINMPQSIYDKFFTQHKNRDFSYSAKQPTYHKVEADNHLHIRRLNSQLVYGLSFMADLYLNKINSNRTLKFNADPIDLNKIYLASLNKGAYAYANLKTLKAMQTKDYQNNFGLVGSAVLQKYMADTFNIKNYKCDANLNKELDNVRHFKHNRKFYSIDHAFSDNNLIKNYKYVNSSSNLYNNPQIEPMVLNHIKKLNIDPQKYGYDSHATILADFNKTPYFNPNKTLKQKFSFVNPKVTDTELKLANNIKQFLFDNLEDTLEYSSKFLNLKPELQKYVNKLLNYYSFKNGVSQLELKDASTILNNGNLPNTLKLKKLEAFTDTCTPTESMPIILGQDLIDKLIDTPKTIIGTTYLNKLDDQKQTYDGTITHYEKLEPHFIKRSLASANVDSKDYLFLIDEQYTYNSSCVNLNLNLLYNGKTDIPVNLININSSGMSSMPHYLYAEELNNMNLPALVINKDVFHKYFSYSSETDDYNHLDNFSVRTEASELINAASFLADCYTSHQDYNKFNKLIPNNKSTRFSTQIVNHQLLKQNPDLLNTAELYTKSIEVQKNLMLKNAAILPTEDLQQFFADKLNIVNYIPDTEICKGIDNLRTYKPNHLPISPYEAQHVSNSEIPVFSDNNPSNLHPCDNGLNNIFRTISSIDKNGENGVDVLKYYNKQKTIAK